MTSLSMPLAASARAAAPGWVPAPDGGAAAVARWQDYVSLLKPRVMSLVVFVGAAGLLVAPGSLHPLLAVVAILAIAIGAGAAGAINMWYDADIDRLMARTSARAIPAGRVPAGDALALGIVLTLLSVLVLGVAVNWTAAAMLALATGFYVGVYTMWLKRRTAQNIVIGGAAGASPPVIGWAAVTGSVADPAPWILFAIIFLWTPPHFWALALTRARDYARAGVPMLPVVAGAAATRRQILLYSLILVPVTLLPAALGLAGPVYLAGTAVLGAVLLRAALAVLAEGRALAAPGAGAGAAENATVQLRPQPAARRLFRLSILYLFLVFALLIADHGPDTVLGGWLSAASGAG